MKCFDVAKVVIDDFLEANTSTWVINDHYLDVFEQYCSYIDKLSDRFYGDGFHVNIDEELMVITVVVMIPYMEIDSVYHDYCRLIEKTVAFGFSADAETDHVLVSFTFPRVWDRREP